MGNAHREDTPDAVPDPMPSPKESRSLLFPDPRPGYWIHALIPEMGTLKFDEVAGYSIVTLLLSQRLVQIKRPLGGASPMLMILK